MSNIDEILKLKALLDEDIITQEEFELKKKEIIESTNTSNSVEFEDTNNANMVKQNSKWFLFILCLFFGMLGIHKFYQGKIVIGIVYLLTCGLFSIGWIIDIISIFISCLKSN